MGILIIHAYRYKKYEGRLSFNYDVCTRFLRRKKDVFYQTLFICG